MSDTKDDIGERKKRAERDLVALGIAVAAILMFLGTGSSVLPQIARSWAFGESGPDNVLVNALLLNVALIVFGLRRYRELVSEISDRRKAEEKARNLAETDALTGCLNRRSIGPATEVLLKSTDPDQKSVAFVMIDLDNFKQVNDLNGHKTGDRVLITTASRIQQAIPPEALLARIGGDEFACVIPVDKNDEEGTDKLIADLVESVSRPITIDGLPIETTISLGLTSNEAVSSDDGNISADALMHQADIAMYHAKKKGKKCYFWFEPSMENELRFRNNLESGIKQGVKKGEFVPYYEQQVDVETGEILGFEMLARWISPELGQVNPNIFIPIAEDIGVISELSESVIEQALEDAKEWDSSLTLSVNISPVQLRDPWFAQKLLKILTKHNFPAERLEIEITESCIHENISIVKSLITSLKNQGVKVSIDDFGTGHSSFEQLRNVPFDRLKIDRVFISELTEEGASEKIVDAIVSLGEGLEMPITAEGIEDTRILEVLQQKGRMKGQGYHFGRPENAATVRERLAKVDKLSKEDGVGNGQEESANQDVKTSGGAAT